MVLACVRTMGVDSSEKIFKCMGDFFHSPFVRVTITHRAGYRIAFVPNCLLGLVVSAVYRFEASRIFYVPIIY